MGGEQLELYFSQKSFHHVKCKLTHPGFELWTSNPFPMSRVPPSSSDTCSMNLTARDFKATNAMISLILFALQTYYIKTNCLLRTFTRKETRHNGTVVVPLFISLTSDKISFLFHCYQMLKSSPRSSLIKPSTLFLGSGHFFLFFFFNTQCNFRINFIFSLKYLFIN